MKNFLHLFFLIFFFSSSLPASPRSQMTAQEMRDKIIKDSSSIKLIEQSFDFFKKNYDKDFYHFFLNKLKTQKKKPWPILSASSPTQIVIGPTHLNIILDLKHFDLNQYTLNGKIIRFGTYNTPQEFLNDILQTMPVEETDPTTASSAFPPEPPRIEEAVALSEANYVLVSSLFVTSRMAQQNCRLALQQIRECEALTKKIIIKKSRSLASNSLDSNSFEKKLKKSLANSEFISKNFRQLKCQKRKAKGISIKEKASTCYKNLTALTTPSIQK